MNVSLLLIACAVAAQDQSHGPNDRLIALSDTERKWMSPDEIAEIDRHATGYADATNGDWDELAKYKLVRDALELTAQPFPPQVKFQTIVNELTSKIQVADLESSLTEFVTKFSSRHKDTDDGKQSCGWIFDQVNALASSRPDLKVTIEKFQHKWGQYSVITRVESSAGSTAQDLVIASAHQDSINRGEPNNAPGADDDGSGSITILESLKYLLRSTTWVPKRPVEFHWYSGEEDGLLGSTNIVKAYAAANKSVYAQMQLDMTGWVDPTRPQVVNLIDDFTDAGLTSFMEVLVKEYLSIPAIHGKCGYGCSDHASWHRAGYRTSYPFETQDEILNPNIHSAKDTLATINYNQMAEFTKLTIAYVVELSQEIQ